MKRYLLLVIVPFTVISVFGGRQGYKEGRLR